MSQQRIGPGRVGLIWAQTRDGIIGADNAIPWRVPEDMAHFKDVTRGHPVVMGRRTWDSLPARVRPLPDRRNIVVTRRPDWAGAGAERADSPAAAVAMADADLVWVMGGGEIYLATMDFATELVVTEVDADVAGDSYAPAVGPHWRVDSDSGWRTSRSGIPYRWLRYVRGDPAPDGADSDSSDPDVLA